MTQSVASCRIAMVLFPRLTQLDLTGPFEVLARMPDARVDLLWHRIEPVASDRGLILTPTATFTDYGTPDILFVPGGPGQYEAQQDGALIAWLATAGRRARLVTSVCTGALVLGAAGLLVGRRATTHWTVVDQLALLGAVPVRERVVVDGNLVTGAGVSAGIDFALTVAARLHGEETAREIQLQIEYDPQPPFTSGSTATAGPALVERLTGRSGPLIDRRRALNEKIGRELGVIA